MRKGAECLIAAWMLAFLPSSPAAADDAPDCRLTKYASLDMRVDEAGHIVVPATIEGHEKILLLNTGSSLSLLTEATVAELGLPQQMLGVGRLFRMRDGTLLNEAAYVSSFSIGGMAGRNFHFGVMPNEEFEGRYPGYLGVDIMRNYDVELDFAAHKMNLFAREHCAGKAIYWTQQPYAALRFHFNPEREMIVQVMLDNVPLTATIDTGSASALSMTVEEARSLFQWRTDPPELHRTGDASSPSTYPFSLLSLGGGASIKYPSVELRNNDQGKYGTATGVWIGVAALKAYHVYISYDDEMIYLTAPDAR